MPTKANDAKTETATETINKSEAVRRAIAAGKTMPNEGVAYIKETFGIEMVPNHFSAIKSMSGGKKRPGRPKGSKNKPAGEPVVARSNGSIELEAIQQVKELVDRLGVATVKELVGIVG